MAVAVANTTVTLNEPVALVQSAATETTIDAAETFTFTPTAEVTTGADFKGVVVIDNAATDQGTVTYSITNGALWAAKGAETGSVAQGVKAVIQIEGGRFNDAEGKFAIVVTPASGKRLLTDHALTASYIQTK